jgi:hypothetical protein
VCLPTYKKEQASLVFSRVSHFLFSAAAFNCFFTSLHFIALAFLPLAFIHSHIPPCIHPLIHCYKHKPHFSALQLNQTHILTHTLLKTTPSNHTTTTNNNNNNFYTMSWQAYVDDNLIGTGKVAKAAIFGTDGSLWASSAGYNVNAHPFSLLEPC